MDKRIQSYLRAAARSSGRTLEQVGPFLATFTLHDPNPYLNYAIPDDGAKPSPHDVSELIKAFDRRDRRPRLEYMSAVAPRVEDVLREVGFVVEGRLPVLIAGGSALAANDPPDEIVIEVASSDQVLWDTLCAIDEAYGSPQRDRTADAQSIVQAVKSSGVTYVTARLRETDSVVGGGLFSTPIDGLTEIAAVGVLAAFRKRGIASSLVVRLAKEAVARGATTPWLMAAHEAEERIYTKVGFERMSEILHISIQPTEDSSP